MTFQTCRSNINCLRQLVDEVILLELAFVTALFLALEKFPLIFFCFRDASGMRLVFLAVKGFAAINAGDRW